MYPEKLLKSFLIFSLSVAWGAVCPLTAAGVTWSEFSNSLNRAFNGDNSWDYYNIAGLALTLIIFALLMTCFKLYTARQEMSTERFYDERRQRSEKKVSRLPDGQLQKRKWFRLKSRTLLKWFHFRGFSPLSESEYRRDHMLDIGGGGLSFTTEKKLDIGAVITFLLDVGGEEPLSVWGKVVRVEEKTDHEPQRFFIAIQFSRLPDNDCQRLVAWIMKGQRNAIHTIRRGENSSAASN